jgi:proton glutamate symport protein
MKKINYHKIKSYLLYLSIILGGLVGHFFPTFSSSLYSWGLLYISFLKMSIIPIIITGIISTIGTLFQKEGLFKKIKIFFLTFIIAFCVTAALAIIIALIAQPGKRVDNETKIKIGQFIAKSESQEFTQLSAEKEITITKEIKKESVGLIQLLTNIIPTNIFKAVNEEQILKVVFFSFILGLALIFVSSPLSNNIISISLGLYQAFQKIISWMMIILPLGLFCLIAGDIALVGTSLLIQLGYFIAIFYLGVILLMILSTYVLALKLKMSFLKTLSGLKETILVAFGSKNIFVAMPFAIKALTKEFNLKENVINLVPLTFTLFGFGFLFIFAYSSVFFSQLYNISLNFHSLLFIFFVSILIIFSISAAPGYIDYTLLSFIFDPLAIPLKPAVILLYAVHPLFEPFAAALSVNVNCAITSFLTEKNSS